jgi:hypothetical protein
MKYFMGEAFIKKHGQRITLPAKVMAVIGENSDDYHVVTSDDSSFAIVKRKSHKLKTDMSQYYPLTISSNNRMKIDLNKSFREASELVYTGLGSRFLIMTVAEYKRREEYFNAIIERETKENEFFNPMQLLRRKR